ncbi:MarR family winged helix-turn-helix transcriptional regulator [Ornithinimicrobium cryptoxanthini]|uniref:MarR family transcriptional regulator n=1 Tax=Ornithinimicrobium cryptoxanthini TaxID=2934161 RepID=A0ABY4YJ36_9MICO|nr:MarR family transcriptional regulator [Ornithinimicrobium cryptoxanthini]USQ76756.1 MarR family transcriptional regulator [Ornithinimicrobium cryptoxanthini]
MDEARWLSPDEQVSWRAYLRGSRLITVAMDEGLAKHGVRLTEYEILSMLSESPGGRLRMSALAHQVVQSRSRLTHTATRLERLGWVRRDTVREDRRGVELTLTDEGRTVVEALSRVHVADVHEVLLDRLTPEEFAVLGSVMTKVVDGIDRPEGECLP